MIIAAFAVAGAGVLASLALFSAAKRAAQEKNRVALERELSTVFTQVRASSADEAEGLFQGMPAKLTMNEHETRYAVTLPPAVLRYAELVERFGSAELKHELWALEQKVTPEAGNTYAKTPDQLVGVFARETGPGENVGTLYTRLNTVAALVALRAKVPAELLTRLKSVRGSQEVDGILLGLSEHFPNAPETELAIEVAAEREHEHADRVRERAQRWRQRAGES